MTKRKKASIIVNHRRGGFRYARNIQLVSGTTGGAAKWGTLYCSAGTTGVETGNVYVAVDTSGTGTKIND
jgi:hypothetical protein